MTHPLVTQLYFTRSEWKRAFDGVSIEEASQRVESINSLSWMIGHLAWQEQSYWLDWAQGKILVPELANYGFGQPASTPPLNEIWSAWNTVTGEANAYLETLTSSELEKFLDRHGKRRRETVGTMLYRMIYHYWYHLGESQAVRQLLGHENVGGFVGNMKDATYRPETN